MKPWRHVMGLDLGGPTIALGEVAIFGRFGDARWANDRNGSTGERLHQNLAPHPAC